MNIIPAIIPKSLTHAKECLDRVTFAKNIQIDVVDGEFVENISWPYLPEGNVSEISELIGEYDVEVDLMVQSPIKAGQDWLAVGAKALVFHIEGVADMNEVLDLHKDKSFNLGLSLNNDTSLETIYPFIDQIDFVQVMGISEIGSQGQPFDVRVLERIASLRALYPNLTISVDGGVNEENISELKKAGANNFVVGSTIVKADDPKNSYEQLLRIISS
jgi:ribulose-phosphate 3-epimerase